MCDIRVGTFISWLAYFLHGCNHVAGLAQEGIFRVNGNTRVVERLKASFDKTGEADLEDAGDVMAVAGMLKLYLRELPEPVIPEHLTHKFVTAQNGWYCITTNLHVLNIYVYLYIGYI